MEKNMTESEQYAQIADVSTEQGAWVALTAARPTRQSRVLAALSLLGLRGLPALVNVTIGYLLIIPLVILVWFAFFAVVITGKYPAWIYRLVTKWLWWTYVYPMAFYVGLTDELPFPRKVTEELLKRLDR